MTEFDSMPRSHLSYCAVRLLSLPCAFTPTKQAWSEDLDEVRAMTDEVTATAPEGMSYLIAGCLMKRIANF